MEVKAVGIIIERDPMTKIPKQIPAWELEIYQEKYPEKIEVTEHTVITIDELPEAHEEAARLRNVLGSDKDSNVPYFDNVYGRGRQGDEQFAKAMHDARVRAPKAAAKAAVKEPVKNPADDKAAGTGPDATDGAGAPTDALDDPA